MIHTGALDGDCPTHLSFHMPHDATDGPFDRITRTLTRGPPRRPVGRTHLALRLASFFLVVATLASPFAVYAVPGVVGGEASYVVEDDRMAPLMRAGDVVVVERVPTTSLGVGDVVSFDRPGRDRALVRRIAVVEQDHIGTYYRTRADATGEVEALSTRPGAVVGRLMTVDLPFVGPRPLVVPFLGTAVRFVETPGGAVFVVAVPVSVLLVLEARTLVRSAKAWRTETDVDPLETEAAGGPRTTSNPFDAPTPGRPEAGDLTMTPAVLGAFAAYSAIVAFVTRADWALAVLAVTLGGLAFAIGTRLGAPSVDEPGAPDGCVVVAEFPDELRSGPRAVVDDRADLLALAVAARRSAVADTRGEGYICVDGGSVLYATGGSRTDGAERCGERVRSVDDGRSGSG